MRSRSLRQAWLQPASCRVPGVDHAQDGQERRSRVPQQLMGFPPLVGVEAEGLAAIRLISLGVPTGVTPHEHNVLKDVDRAVEALQGHQFPLIGDVAVVAKTVRGVGLPGEDAALPSGSGHDVVDGAAVGGVIIQ